MHTRSSPVLYALLGSLPLLLLACERGSAPPDSTPPGTSDVDRLPPVEGDGADTFISDVSGQSSSGTRGATASADGAGGTGAAAPQASPNPGGENAADAGASAQRAISEADIIQLQGDRLFALSQFSGLTVVDIANPAELKVAGHHQTSAMPFEMYLKGDVAYVMFNGYTTYEYVEETQSLNWVQSARLQALDVRDPGHIRLLGDHEIPGDISDSRLVGDVLYLVTFQSGNCWGCEVNRSNTRVASFDVSDPARFAELDALSFDGDANSWGPRSITVTTDRMYVAGPSWNPQGGRGSVQVVDISDPSGALELGAEISIAGHIDSRWQMDEYEGVLRVISQEPGFAAGPGAPWVETFRVHSSHEVTPLGAMQMHLPRTEERLQSARFDGERAYAITFERIDPLFTIDLSDPTAPVQAGELEIPGFVYHMEPRGNRVYGLGFDQNNAEGGMNVSVFDVSDMAHPTMLDRVNFGTQWAQAVEDQDRIHKAFNLMLDQGLILVPFAGGSYDKDSCHYAYRSGIQIIELSQDDLTLRGEAPQLGTARRSILRDTTLLGISDDSIQSFDISDRGAPRVLDKLEVARNIESMHLLGDRILRFGRDWWTERTMLDVTSKRDANAVEPQGEIDLSQVVPDEQDECNTSSYWSGEVLVHGDTAYLTRERSSWKNGTYSRATTVYVLDIAQSTPAIVHSFDLDTLGDNEWYGAMVLTDSALLIGHGRYNWNERRYQSGTYEPPTFYYEIYSLEDPRAPRFIESYQVPELIASRGWGWGVATCGLDMGWGWWYGYDQPSSLVSGDILVSQHEEKVDDQQVKYFMDRLDVSDPSHPQMLDPVNIPGKVIYYDHASGLIVTLEEELRDNQLRDYSDCYWRGSIIDFDFQSARTDNRGRCRVYDRVLNTLRLDGNRARRVSRVNLDDDRNSTSIAVSGARIHVLRTERKPPADQPELRSSLVTSFAVGSDFALRTLGDVELAQHVSWYGLGQVVARGDYAFIQEQNRLNVIDTSDPDSPKLVTHDMPGWYCNSLQVDADHAWCSMGKQGVMRFDLR